MQIICFFLFFAFSSGTNYICPQSTDTNCDNGFCCSSGQICNLNEPGTCYDFKCPAATPVDCGDGSCCPSDHVCNNAANVCDPVNSGGFGSGGTGSIIASLIFTVLIIRLVARCYFIRNQRVGPANDVPQQITTVTISAGIMTPQQQLAVRQQMIQQQQMMAVMTIEQQQHFLFQQQVLQQQQMMQLGERGGGGAAVMEFGLPPSINLIPPPKTQPFSPADNEDGRKKVTF